MLSPSVGQGGLLRYAKREVVSELSDIWLMSYSSSTGSEGG